MILKAMAALARLTFSDASLWAYMLVIVCEPWARDEVHKIYLSFCKL